MILIVNNLGRSGSSWIGKLLSLIDDRTFYVYEPLLQVTKLLKNQEDLIILQKYCLIYLLAKPLKLSKTFIKYGQQFCLTSEKSAKANVEQSILSITSVQQLKASLLR